MRALLVPTTEGEAADMVRAAAAAGRRLAIAGGHTRSGFGHAAKAEAMLRTAGLAGIVAYEAAKPIIADWAKSRAVEEIGEFKTLRVFRKSA